MTDWPVVGFALLGLACWFGFLYLVLCLHAFSQHAALAPWRAHRAWSGAKL